MFFIHCDRCHDTMRAGMLEGNGPEQEPNEDLELFHATHSGCPLRLFQPTGRSMVSGPRHEPMTERWFEVRDRDGLAIAIGQRTSIEEPLSWRIERMAFAEDIDVALDTELFWDTVDRALYPNHVAHRQIAAWANSVTHFLRTRRASDFVVLYDDASRPDQSAGCLTMTARAPLEAAVRSAGFDAATTDRLLALFDDAEFPPLRITRRVTTHRTQRATRRYASARLDSPNTLV